MMNKFAGKILPVLVLASGLQCKHSSSVNPVITGKLVAMGPCNQYVVQVLAAPLNFDSSTVVKTWFNTATDSTYKNVFTVQNICTFPQYGIQVGKLFLFDYDPAPPAQTCSVCQISYSTPAAQNAVKDIIKLGN